MIDALELMTPAEIARAYREGLEIFDHAREVGREHKYDPDDPTLREKNGQSYLAEELVRRYLGAEPANGWLEPDPGIGDTIDGWEIRHTRHVNGHLSIAPNEPEELRYMLVTGTGDRQRICGWLEGARARILGTWRPEYGKIWVAQSDLNPVERATVIELPAADGSRRFTCNRCGDPVDVVELPAPFIDPARFVCGDCLTGRRPAQLELLDAGRNHPVRAEERSYDPAFSEIPY